MKKSRTNFKLIIGALWEQNDSDIDYADQVGEAMGVDYHPYNNSILVNTIIQMLAGWFEESDDAIGEISRFMYDFDFGRCKDCDHITIDNLWSSLNMKGSMLVSGIVLEETPEKRHPKSIESIMEDNLNEKSKNLFKNEIRASGHPDYDRSYRSCSCWLSNEYCKCDPE